MGLRRLICFAETPILLPGQAPAWLPVSLEGATLGSSTEALLLEQEGRPHY